MQMTQLFTPVLVASPTDLTKSDWQLFLKMIPISCQHFLPATGIVDANLQENNTLCLLGLMFSTEMKWSECTENQLLGLLLGKMVHCVVTDNSFH